MAMFAPIPMPSSGNEIFKDVMDFYEQLQKRKAQQQQFSQEQDRLQNQFAQEMALKNEMQPLKLDLLRAQIAKANQPPSEHEVLQGYARQIDDLEKLGKKYGENSPQYNMAKKMFELDNERAQQTMNYQQSLIESQPKRYASATAKLAQEENEISQGIMPGTSTGGKEGVKLTPEQQEKLQGQYGLKQLKNVTDTDVRKRILYANNMEITLNNLNPEHLTSYSGIEGAVDLLRDKSNALRGKILPRYQNYKKALVAAKTLSKQVRQFYGDSITPEIQKGLDQLTNPSSWLEHPQVANARFNAFKNILNTEAQTFKKAAVNADIYHTPAHSSSNDVKTERITIVDSNGHEHTILKRNLQEARKIDPGVKIKGEISE